MGTLQAVEAPAGRRPERRALRTWVGRAALVGLGMLLGTVAGLSAGDRSGSATGADGLVTGIGGVFFKAEDPEALRAWYREHLGIDSGPHGADFLWRDEEEPERIGRTVWTIFPEDTEYFGSRDQALMVNYRVRDLDRVLAHLRESGVEPVDDVQEYSYGRFAWVVDGEGNRVELWEPTSGPAGE